MAEDARQYSGEPPQKMEQVILGLYRKGDTWSPEATPQVQEDQRGHLANFQRLADEGLLLLTGPLTDADPYRGALILDCRSVAEAAALMQSDPHLRSGRLELELYPWWVDAQALKRPLKITPAGDGS